MKRTNVFIAEGAPALWMLADNYAPMENSLRENVEDAWRQPITPASH